MHKKKFYFIVFEGVEGTGKSFQIKKLYKSLIKKKINVIRTREPGGPLTAEKIRNLIFSKDSEKFDSLTDFYLSFLITSFNIFFSRSGVLLEESNT